MSDLVFGAKAVYLLASKVHSFVGDDGVGEPKVTHYVLPEELDNMLPGDFGEPQCIDKFIEVVSGYQQKSQLRLRLGERSHYVQPPLHEGPRTV